MISDYFKLAFRNVLKRKLRSWLTILGIFIAVATIFVLISLSLGLENAVNEQFRLLGTDKFFIFPKGQLGSPGTGGAVELTIYDARAIKKVKGVKDISYFTISSAEVVFNREKRFYQVVGLPPGESDVFKEVAAYKADEGKLMEDSDRGVVMIGSRYKYNNIFSKPVKAGDKIEIKGVKFIVKGILSPVGNPSDDSLIYMSLDDAKIIFNIGEKIDQIVVQIKENENIDEVAERTAKKLREVRKVDRANQDFYISTPEELVESFGTILNIITGFLVGVAAISLLIGGIGIANTMYTSVLERTKEIGTMKAVGAKNKDILFIFLIESGLLGLVGGIIGVLLGIAISKGIELYAIYSIGTTLLRAAISFYLILGCLIFAFLTGTISGIWPAWRAIKIKPVDALRYE